MKRLLALSRRDRRLLVEAVAALALARALLVLLPFGRATRVIGLRAARGGDAVVVPGAGDEGVQLGRAISRAAPRMPFRAVCLEQAMACAIMARRRGLPVIVRFGVTHDPQGKLIAHAWTTQGRLVLTGAPGHERFSPIATFIS